MNNRDKSQYWKHHGINIMLYEAWRRIYTLSIGLRDTLPSNTWNGEEATMTWSTIRDEQVQYKFNIIMSIMAQVTLLTLGIATKIHVSPQNSSIFAPKCQIYLSPTAIYLVISCPSNNLPGKHDTTLPACDTFLSKSPRFSMKKLCWHILTTMYVPMIAF